MSVKNATAIESVGLSAKNYRFVLVIFGIVIAFQLTALKYIWAIERLATIANLGALLLLTVYAFHSIASGFYSKKIWLFYILPGLTVFIGMAFNIGLNIISDLMLISYLGMILPWVAYLSVPELIKKNAINSDVLWRYYYYFMLVANILGLLDYALLLFDISTMRMLETPFGVFLGGKFSLLHMLEDGTAHYRFYACFIEPGTLAMFLLPAIAYAYFNRKYVGLIVFLIAFYLTDSLGGVISLFMLAVIILFISVNRKKNNMIYAVSIIIVSSAVLWAGFGEYVIKKYEERENSRTIREDTLSNTMRNLPSLLVNNPTGFKLAVDTETARKNEMYYGYNFTPGNMLQFGGVYAFLGYLICLFVSAGIALISLARDNLSREEKVVFSSLIVLLPFIFQRTTVWDSAIFAFLFAPSIIRVLQTNKQSNKHGPGGPMVK